MTQTLEALAAILPATATGASRVRPLTDREIFEADSAPSVFGDFAPCRCAACERYRAAQ